MRSPLNKRLPREFKDNLGKYISIFLILTATIVIGSAFLSVMGSMEYTLNTNREECLIEDGQFESYSKITDEVIKEVKDCGVEIAKNFYVLDEKFDNTATLKVFANREEINLASVFEGRLPENEGEIAIERLIAQNRDINVGDIIEVKGEKMVVTGTISVPDYSSLFKSNADLMPDGLNFGVALVSSQTFELFDVNEQHVNYNYRLIDRDFTDKEKQNVADKIKTTLIDNGVSLTSFVTSKDNSSISFVEEDMGSDGPTMRVFLCILVVIIAFVFAVLIGNMIESESTIIGTLRSAGYTKDEMIIHYLKPAIIISVAAAVIGNVIGYTIMQEPFKSIYYKTYSMAPYRIRFSLEAFIVTTVVPIALMVLINYFMLHSKLSLSPLKFLRNDIKTKRQSKAAKLPDVKFIKRFRMRVILQNKGSYIVLFFGIFLASFLLMFGVGLKPMLDSYVNDVSLSVPYNYQYILKQPIECEKGEKITVYELETYHKMSKGNIAISFMGISGDSDFYDISFSSDSDEIVISDGVAAKLGLEVGDEIKFEDPYSEKGFNLKVSDIYDYNDNMVVFISWDCLNEMLGYENGYFNSYISKDALDIDTSALARTITKDDITKIADQMTYSFKEILFWVDVFSIGIYLILMYLLTKVVIDKNKIHIAFMKVFGYEDREINKLYLRATTVTVIVSLFVCIPIEILAFKYIMIYVSSMMDGWIPFKMPIYVYGIVILTGIISYFLINLLHIRKIRKLPMEITLKNRE